MKKTMFAVMLVTTLSTAAIASGAFADRPNSGIQHKELTGVVNINTATVREIARLPGVGESVAIRIVERRLQMPFSKPEDLMSVKGIGAAKYEKIRQFISVTGKTTFGVSSAAAAASPLNQKKTPRDEPKDKERKGDAVSGQLAPAQLDSIAYV